MTVLTAQQRNLMRSRYRLRIHNNSFTVRMKIGEISEQINPNIRATKKPSYAEFNGFKGSIYNSLSGVVGRIVQRHNEFSAAPAGLIDNTFFVIQYVPDIYDILAASGLATGLVDSNTNLVDSAASFDTKVRVGAKVLNLTDGSSALVETVAANTLVTDGLVDGSDNLFEETDEYEVYNLANLQVGDMVYHLGQWRNVLFVIPDSEGVQTTAFLSE